MKLSPISTFGKTITQLTINTNFPISDASKKVTTIEISVIFNFQFVTSSKNVLLKGSLKQQTS
jgi:hypothetical protein